MANEYCILKKIIESIVLRKHGFIKNLLGNLGRGILDGWQYGSIYILNDGCVRTQHINLTIIEHLEVSL